MKRNWIFQSKQQLRGFSEGDFIDPGILLCMAIDLLKRLRLKFHDSIIHLDLSLLAYDKSNELKKH